MPRGCSLGNPDPGGGIRRDRRDAGPWHYVDIRSNASTSTRAAHGGEADVAAGDAVR
jgi:hypothetical protein